MCVLSISALGRQQAAQVARVSTNETTVGLSALDRTCTPGTASLPLTRWQEQGESGDGPQTRSREDGAYCMVSPDCQPISMVTSRLDCRRSKWEQLGENKAVSDRQNIFFSSRGVAGAHSPLSLLRAPGRTFAPVAAAGSSGLSFCSVLRNEVK